MRKVGSGITERGKRAMAPATPETLISFLRGISETISEPWGGQGPLIESARERLQEIKAEAPSIFDDLEGHNSYFVERATLGWYLQAIDAEAHVIEEAVAEGRPWQAVACAMQIGELVTELRMKQLWEPHALRGQDALEATRRGGASTRKTTDEQKVACYRKFRANGHNKTDATYLAAQELCISESNIRAARKSAGTSD